MFATAAPDADGGCLKLWDLRTAGCVRRFAGHACRSFPVGAALSPCMRFVAAGSEDCCAYVWDLRQGTVLARLRGPADCVADVAFHGRAGQLAACSLDGRVHFFGAG